MSTKIIVYMVVRNILERKELFLNVVSQAQKISKNFCIIDHGSNDASLKYIKKIFDKHKLKGEVIREEYKGTMDEVKGKYFKYIKSNSADKRQFILSLDSDEVLNNDLIDNINSIDYVYDIYMLNIHTYLLQSVIDKNHYQPRLFELQAVDMGCSDTFHQLFRYKSKHKTKLGGVIEHYSYVNIEGLLKKNLYYAKGEAITLYSKNKNISNIGIFVRMVFESIVYFIYTLVYHVNFMHLEGWLYSMNWFVYKYNKYVFYLELKYNGNG